MSKVFIFFIIFSIFSCSKEDYVAIDVSTTNNLAMSSQWAVITEPYVSYAEEPVNASKIATYGRIGDVVEVVGSSIDNDNQIWYKFEGGWLSQKSIRIYANKLQANHAAKDFQ